MKPCEPGCRKANIIEFRSLSLASLSSKELSIRGSRFRDSQQVGESPSSQQAKKNSLNRENVESGRMCLFVDVDQLHDKNLPQLRPVAPKNSTTAPRTLRNFYKFEPFINAGLGLVLQKICLKYITVLPLRDNGVLMVSIYFFLLLHQWKANKRFHLFFSG